MRKVFFRRDEIDKTPSGTWERAGLLLKQEVPNFRPSYIEFYNMFTLGLTKGKSGKQRRFKKATETKEATVLITHFYDHEIRRKGDMSDRLRINPYLIREAGRAFFNSVIWGLANDEETYDRKTESLGYLEGQAADLGFMIGRDSSGYSNQKNSLTKDSSLKNEDKIPKDEFDLNKPSLNSSLEKTEGRIPIETLGWKEFYDAITLKEIKGRGNRFDDYRKLIVKSEEKTHYLKNFHTEEFDDGRKNVDPKTLAKIGTSFMLSFRHGLSNDEKSFSRFIERTGYLTDRVAELGFDLGRDAKDFT